METMRLQPSEREWEGKIQDFLKHSHFPPEIISRWEERYRMRPRSEQYAALEELAEKRRVALSGDGARMASPSHVEIVGEPPLAVQRMVENLASGSHEKIGEGKSGRVIGSVRSPELCYKVLFPPERQPSGTNDIAIEADLQGDVAKLGTIAGVRAPKVKFFVKNKIVRAIAMERLDAVSIKDVLEGTAPLPPAFNAGKFFASLRAYIAGIHEKGYYHRDLHGGNVLIDNETSMPRVIDFGHATRTIGEEGVYETEIVQAGRRKTIVLLSDIEAPKLLEKKIAAYIAD